MADNPPPIESDEAREVLLARIDNAAISALNQRLNSGSLVPHSAELLEAILKLCGGVETFAAICWSHYYRAKAGSAARSKILDSVMKLAMQNTAVGGAKKPLRMMDDD